MCHSFPRGPAQVSPNVSACFSVSTSATAMHASTEAGLSSRGKTPRVSAVAESAKGTGARARTASSWSAKTTSAGTAARERRPPSVVPMKVGIAVIERMAVERIRAATIQQAPVVPIKTPSVPTPPESEEGANAKTDAERKIRASDAPPRIESRPESNWIAIDQFGIIIGDVNDVRIRRLDDNVGPLVSHRLLWRGL